MVIRSARIRAAALLLCSAPAWLWAPNSYAVSSYLTAFESNYPGSTTGNAGCAVCHGTNTSGGTRTSTFNVYGAVLRGSGAIVSRLSAAESLDSDGEGHTNLQEITAGAQPGWCVASSTGCNNGGFTLPVGVSLLDPAASNQAPTADPGGPYSATAGVAVTLDGSGSSDPDGSIASYNWNFGDGSTGSGVSPNVTYASAGSYTVSLTVTDDGGAASAAATTTVTVNVGLQPPLANAGGPYAGTVATAISFDGTGSSDPDGSIVSYAWNFGDGSTGSGPAPSHAYATGGVFTVTLTVTDSDNLQDSATASVNVADASGTQPPVANAGGPYSGKSGTAIQFDGRGSSDPDGSIVSYDWDFGDGNATSGATPVHTYAVAGSYTVTLTVTDDTGRSDSASASAQVTDPVNQLPTADPGGPYSAQPGETIAFDGAGSSDPDGSIVSYAWNFGDGTVGSGASPGHAYAAAGDYLVTLVVTDDAGADSALASTQVTVRAAGGGEALYLANCADCHGDPWDGPAVDASLSGLKRVAGARACTIEGAIFGTSVFPGGVPDMVAYGNQGLTSAEIDAIAGYLNSRDANGEQRYVAACGGCHGNDGRGGRVDEGVRGEDAGDIREAIREERTMTFLACLPSSDVESMVAFLSGKDPQDDSSTPSASGGGGSTGPLSLLGLTLLWAAGRRCKRQRPAG